MTGVRPGSGSERWRAALPVAQQPAASGCQPERDQPTPTDVAGKTQCQRHTHMHTPRLFPDAFP